MLRDYILRESAEFSKMEDCPFIYILVMPRLVKLGAEATKKDEILKNAIDLTEKVIKELPKDALNQLEKAFTPATILDLFKVSTNHKVLFATYFEEFKKNICNSTSSFSRVLELDKKLCELYNSPEYEIFKNNI